MMVSRKRGKRGKVKVEYSFKYRVREGGELEDKVD